MTEVPVPQKEVQLPPIEVINAQFPLTISWQLKENNHITCYMPHPDNSHQDMILDHAGRVGINGGGKGNKTILIATTSISPCNQLQPKTRMRKHEGETVDKGVPKEYALKQNVPNPFNPVTIINFELPQSGPVELKVYNMLGQEVRTLVDRVEDAGYHAATFDASSLASGVYFYRMRAGAFTAIMKMVVIK